MKKPKTRRQPDTTWIENAVEAGIEAASNAVSTMGLGDRAWGAKEFEIARTAAREAIIALYRIDPGKKP